MTDDENESFAYIEGEDGTLALFDKKKADADVKYLVGLMIMVRPEKPVNTELMRIHAENGSFTYTRWVADEAMKLLSAFMLEAIDLFTLEFTLQHLKSFIYSYRHLRPTDPTGESKASGD